MNELIGKVKISNDAIASIAAVATNEVKGATAINRTFGKNIKVSVEAGEITLEIPVVVEGECAMPKVCRDVQEKVKTVLESTTGLKVGDIKILVSEVTVK